MDFELCCFATQLLDTVEINDGVAAWAQFFGAMIAVALSWWIAHRDAKQARKDLADQRVREEARELDRLVGVRLAAHALVAHGAGMADHAVGTMRGVIGQPAPVVAEMARQCREDMATVEATLLAFPFHEIGHPDAIRSFVQTQTLARSAQSLLEHIRNAAITHRANTPSLAPLVNIKESFEEAEQFLRPPR